MFMVQSEIVMFNHDKQYVIDMSHPSPLILISNGYFCQYVVIGTSVSMNADLFGLETK